jgi:hypothetical protein
MRGHYRVMWAKARRQFGKMFYRKMASQLNVWDGPFQVPYHTLAPSAASFL